MTAEIPSHALTPEITRPLDVGLVAHQKAAGEGKNATRNDAQSWMGFFIVAGTGSCHIRIENVNKAELDFTGFEQRHPRVGAIVGLNFSGDLRHPTGDGG